MKMRHGSFQIDLPDDWSDASVLVFTAPPVDDPRLRGKASGTPAITVRILRRGESAQAILQEQRSELEATSASFQLLGEGPFMTRVGQGWHHHQRVVLEGRPVQQLVVACRLGPFVLIGSGAAPDASFSRERDVITRALASMDAVQP